MQSKVRELTISGIFCALSIVMLLTGLIPAFVFVSIDVAIGTLVVIKKFFGTKQWLTCTVATSILSLMIVPDLELSLTFVCMSWYPLVRYKVMTKPKCVRIPIKLVCCTIASIIIYCISIAVFGSDEIVDKIPFFEVLYVLMFSLLFGVLDVILRLFDIVIIPRISKILRTIRND